MSGPVAVAARERPILFTGEMVRAILAGTKTQTRRIVKPQPPAGWSPVPRFIEIHGRDRHGELDPDRVLGHGFCTYDGEEGYACRYGAPGDRLWVRERSRRIGAVVRGDGRPVSIDVQYEADGEVRLRVPFPERLKPVEHGRRLSMGCYREASRVTLEISDIRVQRLKDISDQDAFAEGSPVPNSTPTNWYACLWEQINGLGSWDANPWVWVVSFKRMAA